MSHPNESNVFLFFFFLLFLPLRPHEEEGEPGQARLGACKDM